MPACIRSSSIRPTAAWCSTCRASRRCRRNCGRSSSAATWRSNTRPSRIRGRTSATVPGLIVGEPVSTRAGVFELYYRFPLTAEQNTIEIVQRTVLLAGLSLVFLVALIALIVTRQVVRPVRVAARTAERLAAGDLAQRMRVKGSDDIALLGRSFNDMAGSLQRQFRRLEQLSRVQRRFTSDVSHELRTPLTTIRMAAEVLHSERGDFAPELARSVELLLNELDRFESLLADLLEISRYDAGAANLEAEVLDLRGVVSNAVDGSRVLAQRHGSEMVVLGVDARGTGRDGSAPGRADPAQPARQCPRSRRGPAGDRDRRGERRRRRGHRARSGRRAATGRGRAGVQPVLARRPVAQPADRRYRAGPVDQPRGRPAARRLAAGLGRAGQGRAVPAHPAARRPGPRSPHRRCRSSPRTRRR